MSNSFTAGLHLHGDVESYAERSDLSASLLVQRVGYVPPVV